MTHLRRTVRALLTLGAPAFVFTIGLLLPTPVRAQLDPWLRAAAAAPATGLGRTIRPAPLTLVVTTDDGVGLRRAVEQLGGSVGSLTGRVATLHLSADRLRELAAVPGIRTVQGMSLGLTDAPMLDRSTGVGTLPGPGGAPIYLGTRADLTQSRGVTGAGVLVGVVDQGISVTHPDFRLADNSSRLLVLWDQTVNNAADTLNNNRAVTPTAPSYPYGREWSKAQIEAGVVTQTAVNHGTQVPGIAVGNGRGNAAYVAMAPGADLLYVKTTFALPNVVDAFTYLVAKAQALGRPLVVNYSGGGHFGAHDGTRADELAIDDLSGPGVLFVAAGGNSGNQPIHSSHVFPGAADTLTANQPNTVFAVDVWVPGEIPVNLTAISPDGTVYGPIPPDSVRFYVLTETTELLLANLVDSSPNGDRELIVETVGTTPVGAWRVILTPTGPISPRPWHAWAYAGGTTLTRFLDATTTLTMPSSGQSVISAGAYRLTNGYLWPGSSRGPSRDGRVKPDLVAPTNVAAPIPAGGGYGFTTDGTSFSAPHVAGALALALELNPLLDPTAARNAFAAHALVDPATGAVPNISYGYGKLNADLVLTDVPLPVALSGFSAAVLPTGGVGLSWQTESERDHLGFDLERATPTGWQPVADFRTAPGLRASGSGATARSYAHRDGRGRPGDRYRLGSTDLNGTHHRLAEVTVEATDGAALPTDFALLAPSPNPFNPTTRIDYRLPTAGRVKLDVFDVLGRRVRTLVDGVQAAGSYSATLDGSDLSSGVYTIRLRVAETALVRRAMLVK